MLLQFSVANHLSIRDRQVISLTASSLLDEEESLIDCPVAPNGKVVPAAIIYGANASGKSNVVAALRYMRSAVLKSHSQGEPSGGVPRSPFSLDPTCAEAPSIFDVDFVLDKLRFHYGFEVTDDAFTAEWLYAFPNGRRQKLFHRVNSNVKFGRSLKGRNSVIADLMRPNSLYLSVAAQNDHEQLSKIFELFYSINIDEKISIGGQLASLRLYKGDIDNRIIDFLSDIGTGVFSYQKKEEEFPERVLEMFKGFGAVMKQFTGEELNQSDLPNKKYTIELGHRGKGGEVVYFDLDKESAGTRRLLVMLSLIFRALDKGTLLVVDELDASLHTKACEALLALFCSRSTNPNGAQLIGTTHDTNLLRAPFLRRDQVWFAEKDATGATHLFPLTDIRTRKGDNLAKGYLQGRFGGMPSGGPSTHFSVD